MMCNYLDVMTSTTTILFNLCVLRCEKSHNEWSIYGNYSQQRIFKYINKISVNRYIQIKICLKCNKYLTQIKWRRKKIANNYSYIKNCKSASFLQIVRIKSGNY